MLKEELKAKVSFDVFSRLFIHPTNAFLDSSKGHMFLGSVPLSKV